jgi:hypothetical protein
MRFLDATDLENLADEMPTERDRVLTMLLGWTGLRAGEASPSVAGTSTYSDRRIMSPLQGVRDLRRMTVRPL